MRKRNNIKKNTKAMQFSIHTEQAHARTSSQRNINKKEANFHNNY